MDATTKRVQTRLVSGAVNYLKTSEDMWKHRINVFVKNLHSWRISSEIILEYIQKICPDYPELPNNMSSKDYAIHVLSCANGMPFRLLDEQASRPGRGRRWLVEPQ